MHHLLGDTRTLLINGSVLAGVIILSLILHKVAFLIVKRVFRKRGAFLQHALTARAENPARFIFPLIGLVLALPFLPINYNVRVSVERVLGLGVIACVGLGGYRLGERDQRHALCPVLDATWRMI